MERSRRSLLTYPSLSENLTFHSNSVPVVT
nr:MAG TPA: hypothetical protein [Caudoviricetes sp.]